MTKNSGKRKLTESAHLVEAHSRYFSSDITSELIHRTSKG